MRRVVLVGATGAFGQRMAALLATRTDIALVLAARGETALRRLAADLTRGGAAAAIEVAVFDRERPGALAGLAPFLVIDAAGPFQGSAYGLAAAAIAAGAHAIDIADARAFVAGFPAALDGAARAAGVLAATGASSTPALSQAALAGLVAGWTRLDTVTVAISPGARAPRGLSVVQAILSYAGRPVRVFQDGRWGERPGWSGTQRLDMPGLGRRWAALCETPDLDLLPERFPVRESALFLAGLELAPMHLGLAALTLPVRWGWVGSLLPLARPLRAAADLLAGLGSDRGGMLVEAAGLDRDGRATRARWSLVAEANAGPNVPVAAAAALARALLDGHERQVGAVVAAGLVPLAAIMAELAALPIRTRIDTSEPASPILFRRLVGRAMDGLPAAVRAVHDREGPGDLSGPAVARRGRGWPARLIGQALGLPKPGRHAVAVSIRPEPGGSSGRAASDGPASPPGSARPRGWGSSRSCSARSASRSGSTRRRAASCGGPSAGAFSASRSRPGSRPACGPRRRRRPPASTDSGSWSRIRGSASSSLIGARSTRGRERPRRDPARHPIRSLRR